MGQELRNQEFRQEFFSGMGHSRSEPGIPGSGTPEGGTLAGVLQPVVVLAKYPTGLAKTKGRDGPSKDPCLAPEAHATCGNSSTRSSRTIRRSGDRNANAVAKSTGTYRRTRYSITSAIRCHARLYLNLSHAPASTKTSTRTSKLQCSASMPRSSRRSLP